MVNGQRIKICGIKTIEEIQIINDYPLDYAGFIFAKSKRQIDPDGARQLIGQLKSNIKPIGVFVEHNFEDIVDIILKCDLYGVQLHGDMAQDFEYAKKLRRLIISKAINLKAIWKSISIGKGLGDYSKNLDPDSDTASFITEAKLVAPYVDGIVFDTYKKGERGGTGECFNWDALEAFDRSVELILAGGLSPDNVMSAKQTVHPDVLDVNSTLEVNLIKQRDRVDALFKALA